MTCSEMPTFSYIVRINNFMKLVCDQRKEFGDIQALFLRREESHRLSRAIGSGAKIKENTARIFLMESYLILQIQTTNG